MTDKQAASRKRLRELLELRDRIEFEIWATRAELDLRDQPRKLGAEIRATRERLDLLLSLRPPRKSRPRKVGAAVKVDRRRSPLGCGTETGYQRHRHLYRKNGEGVWPLPADDPCGCRAAHAKYEAERTARLNRLDEMGLAA